MLKILDKKDMQAASATRSNLGDADRRMRRKETAASVKRKPSFFTPMEELDPVGQQMKSPGADRALAERSPREWRVNKNNVIDC